MMIDLINTKIINVVSGGINSFKGCTTQDMGDTNYAKLSTLNNIIQSYNKSFDEILGGPGNCCKTIRRAFLQMAKLSHPDLNKGNEKVAAQAFIIVANAHAELNDALGCR